MKNLRMLALIVGIVVAGLAFSSVANAASPSEYSKDKTFKHDGHKDKHKVDKMPKNKHKADKMSKEKNKHKGDKMPKGKNKPAKEKGRIN